jgi:hypothetical protein
MKTKINQKDNVSDAAMILIEFLNRFEEPQNSEQASVVRAAMQWLERNGFTND